MLLYLSVLLLSAAALAYEVLLMRLLSIVQWHHFAYMVISLALLGYGASGTFLSLAREGLLRRFGTAYLASAGLFGLLSLACWSLAQRLPFNPLELVWDPRQLLYLAALYLLLSVPFFCAATAIGLALARFRGGLHAVYASDLLGAGLGSLGILALLFLLFPLRCLEVLSALGLAAAGLAACHPLCGRRLRLGAALMAAAVVLPLAWPRGWSELRVSEFKALSQALRVPGARVVEERSSPLGLLTVVESPRIPFRHAPGLSLAYTDEPPEQLGVFTDGGSFDVITRFAEGSPRLGYLDYLTSSLAYHLLAAPRVAVLGAGGGSEVLSAVVHDAARVDAVELNPQLAQLTRETYAELAGRLYQRPGVTLHVAEIRGFLARQDDRWDLIQLAAVDGGGAAAAGTHALAESYLYTVEALQLYLEHLRPGGFLALTREVAIPPRETLKLVATAVAALESRGVTQPGRRFILIRGWSTATLLVKRGEVTPEEIATTGAFCDARSFDLAYYPGMPAGEANRYNVLEEPHFYRGAMALVGPERSHYLADYKFYLQPATDERPYFGRFFRWRVLPELLALRGRGGTPLIQWSYLIVVATLAQAALAAALLILLPLVLAKRRALRRPGTPRVGLYFLALGLAFLFVEIALIHRFTLFLSHPLYAVAVVLGSFLLFAGLGSASSRRLASWGQIRGLTALARPGFPAFGAALLVVLYLFALPPLFGALIWLGDAARIGVSVALLAPLAFLMGMPFPVGLTRAEAEQPEWLPWAWAVNGCASVLGAVLATLLALHLGFGAVLGLAAGLYLGAAGLVSRI